MPAKNIELLKKQKTVDSSQRANRGDIFLFCISTFFLWTALYLYVPILPVYAQSLGASLSVIGLIVASYALPQMLFRIPIGIISDATGIKKPFMIFGILMTSCGALGLWLSPDPWFLLISRTVIGAGAATWVIFTVYFASLFSDKNTGKAIGIINFVNSVAILISTISGGFIAENWGNEFVFIIAFFFGMISLVAMLPVKNRNIPKPNTLSTLSFHQIATNRVLLAVSFMSILLQFTQFAGTFGFIPVYGVQIGASSADLGIITMLSIASSAVGSLIAERVMRYLGSTLTIVLSSFIMGATLITIPLITDVYLLEVNQFISGFGKGILGTLFMFLSIKTIAPHQRATAMGVYQAVYAIGMLLGPLLSGLLAESQGLISVFYLSASLCALIAIIAFLPVLRKI